MLQATPAGMQAIRQDKPVGLKAVRDLFGTLKRDGIRYCHWKSNVRLAAALDGSTDLDLLVDDEQQGQFRQILQDNGVKMVLAAPGKRYPGLEDYLGFDPETGRQFHMHVHFKLVLGEQFVKNYHIPIESHFLNSVRECHGVNVPAPEVELIVLAMRGLLKYRDRDVIKDVLTIRTPGIPAHILEEVNWLLSQTSVARIARVLDDLGDTVPGDIVLAFLNTITESPRDGRMLFRLRQRLRRSLRVYQRHQRIWATTIYFRELWQRRNRFLRFAPMRQMTLPGNGLTLALVGVDGAGKTTLSQAVADWLAWKLQVYTYYLGSKQPSWMSDWSYLFFRMGRRGHRELSLRIGENNLISRTIEAVRDFWLYSHYLFIGYDRLRRFLAGRQRAAEGAMVVYDRYPLAGPLDGPQIHRMVGGKSAWRGIFSRFEQRLYRQMHLPDLLIVLEVSPEMSLQRKPDHHWEAIVEKYEVLGRLTAVFEKNGTEAIRIDADQPLEVVLSQVKMAIWQRLGVHHDR